MTLELLLSARDALTKSTLYTFEDVQKSIHLFKYIKKADQYVSFFAQEQEKLLTQYGSRTGDDVTIPCEHTGEYRNALSRLLNTKVDDMPPFPVVEDDFEQAVPPKSKKMRLSVGDLIVIEKLNEASSKKKEG